MRFLSSEGHKELVVEAMGLALVGIPLGDQLLLLIDDRLEIEGQLGIPLLESLQVADEVGPFPTPLQVLLVAGGILTGHRLDPRLVAGLRFAE